MGTLGTETPAPGFSCVSDIAADDEAISSSPPSVLSSGSAGEGFDVEDGIGGLEAGSSVGFMLEDMGSTL